MIACLACLLACLLACFDVSACCMACLLASISAALDGFGFHFGGLGDILGMGWVPDWPGDRAMGWIAFPLRLEHRFTRIQGPR